MSAGPRSSSATKEEGHSSHEPPEEHGQDTVAHPQQELESCLLTKLDGEGLQGELSRPMTSSITPKRKWGCLHLRREAQLIYCWRKLSPAPPAAARPVGKATAPPKRSRCCPELFLSPNGCSFTPACPSPHLFTVKAAPVLCSLDLPLVSHSVHVLNCGSFGYFRIHSF